MNWFKQLLSPNSRPENTPSQQIADDALLPPLAIRQLHRLQLNASRYLPGYASGLRPSVRRKPAADFREHRMYVTGDDVRFVDWKASARQEHIFVKQGEHPKEATVYLLLDCSASMAWGNPPKRSTALSLAAALGYLALSNHDRLVVLPFARTVNQPLGPITGKGQVPFLLSYLRSISFGGAGSLSDALHDFSRRLAVGGGLVLLISDLLGATDLHETLALLPAPTWDVVVFHLLHPQELAPTLRGDFELFDSESGVSANYDLTPQTLNAYKAHLQDWRTLVESACVENNAFYTLIPSNWSLEREIIAHLRENHLVNLLT